VSVDIQLLYIYLHTGHTALNTRLATAHTFQLPKNRQWLSTSNQEQFIRIASANKRQWTTIHARTQRSNHLTGPAILHRWITHHRPPLGLQSDTATSTLHLHHAHAARTAAPAHRTRRLHQPGSQAQPTHAPMTTESKATQRLSKLHYQPGHCTILT
jgi:hypothetical protein